MDISRKLTTTSLSHTLSNKHHVALSRMYMHYRAIESIRDQREKDAEYWELMDDNNRGI